jgi:hypothetical protein
MLPRLQAEEELLARLTTVHPYLEARSQADHIARLMRQAGLEEPPQRPKSTEAIAALGIKIVTGD